MLLGYFTALLLKRHFVGFWKSELKKSFHWIYWFSGGFSKSAMKYFKLWIRSPWYLNWNELFLYHRKMDLHLTKEQPSGAKLELEIYCSSSIHHWTLNVRKNILFIQWNFYSSSAISSFYLARKSGKKVGVWWLEISKMLNIHSWVGMSDPAWVRFMGFCRTHCKNCKLLSKIHVTESRNVVQTPYTLCQLFYMASISKAETGQILWWSKY